MQGLEKRPDFPKEKPWYFRPGKDTQVDYNIISNTDMTEHHFQAPEKRPPPDPPVVSTLPLSSNHLNLKYFLLVTSVYLNLAHKRKEN